MLSFRCTVVVTLLLYAASSASPTPTRPSAQEFNWSGPLIRVSTDTLWVTEESVEVEQPERLAPGVLAAISSGDVGRLLRSPGHPNLFLEQPPDSGRGLPNAKPTSLSGSYQSLLGKLIQHLSRDAGRTLTLAAGPDHLAEAQSIYQLVARNKFIRSDQLNLLSLTGVSSVAEKADSSTSQRRRLTVDPGVLHFQTSEGLQQAAVESWRLQIRDARGEVVKSIQAGGAFPGEMTWDWKGPDGELAKSAFYSYSVNWTSVDGTVHTAVAGYIKVIRRVRRIKLQVRKGFARTLSERDAVFLIVR